ncbi:MAG: LON peptidase substrate-binding domain-containing protein [Gaiellales bacterium]
MASHEFGLFPLATVLVPGELIPLHIFEERYKDLIAECLETAEPFVLLYADDEGTREIGCTARVTEVLEKFDDGRMNIAVEGGEVVRVLEITRGRSYTTAVVEQVDDDPDAGDEARAALELYRKITEAAGAEPADDIDDHTRPMSYAIMGRVEFPAAEKQRLLEMRSERERLMAIVELLARGLQVMAQLEAVRERAKSNGKVPHSRG